MDNEPARWPGSPHTDPVAVVVLEHHQEDEGVHWDLLVARGPAPATLWSARCASRPDTAPVGSAVLLERTEDHRRAWLEREGALSGHRGAATRRAAGLMCVGRVGEAAVSWADGRTSRWRLRRDGASLYLLVME